MHSTMITVLLLAAAMAAGGGSAFAAPKADAPKPADAKPGFQPPRDVEFKAEVDGSVERYVEMLPTGYDPKKECDLLVGLHGHGSDRWQYAANEQYNECKAARAVAAKHGMIFVSPDYRATTSWMGPKAEADLVQIIRDVRKERKIGRVILVGASMGGASVLIFTALHPELVDGVSSQNGTANMVEYNNFQTWIIKSYGGAKTEKPEEYRKRSPELAPERFKGIAVAITCGGKDTAVPPDSVLRLAKKLEEQDAKSVLLIHRPEGGHATSYDDTVKALEFVIERAAAKAPRASRTSASSCRPTC